MRCWDLGRGDPLFLTLAADFRLCNPDYVNDQIWELELGGGDPPAFSLHTTYGLRARGMRLFPRFSLANRTVTDPAFFEQRPRVKSFFPNFLEVDFSPFPGIEITGEYWAVDSHSISGRITLVNRSGSSVNLLLELCGQLAPFEGQSLSPVSIHSVNVLTGKTSDLEPVIFLTGGPHPGPGPYPSLANELVMGQGEVRCLTWVHTALGSSTESFDLARRIAARSWQAERSRIELVNTAQTVEIQTGNPDWDAALAFSQSAAFGLFFLESQFLPYPSFVLSRQPDLGHSARGDGNDFPSAWNGQTPLESLYLSSLLPGAPNLAAGLVRNFLAVQTAEGFVDWKPGLAGQRGNWLAAPLIASLAWKTFNLTRDRTFLQEIRPGLSAFIHQWLSERHDRDQDGFPEWDHPLQTGLEDNPAFSIWLQGGQGVGISYIENPALAAMLSQEAHSLALISEALGDIKEKEYLQAEESHLKMLAGLCWDESAGLYHNRDRATHLSPKSKYSTKLNGNGSFPQDQAFKEPQRLVIRIRTKGEGTRHPQITLQGQDGESPRTENLERLDFFWGPEFAVATSNNVYTRLDLIQLSGLVKRDQVFVQTVDLSHEDVSLFLPLWAGIPDADQIAHLIDTITNPNHFGRPFGIPACSRPKPNKRQNQPDLFMEAACKSVHIPWNALVGEGLLACGERKTAAELTNRLMDAVIQNLKRQNAFYRAYDSETGAGIGERNSLQGFTPVGLFLDVLGVEIQSPRRVILSGKNPFPWPVTVKYRGLVVTRQAEQTDLVFPDGQTFSFNDPTDATISVD